MSEKFLKDLKKIINVKKKIIYKTDLESIGWDSMMALTFMGLADQKYKKKITANQLIKCKNIQNLIDLVK